MSIVSVGPDTSRLQTGDVWVMTVLVTSYSTSVVVPDTATVTVTNPAGTTSTPTVTKLSTGLFQAVAPVNTPGRWVASFTATNLGVATLAAYVEGITTAGAMPDVDDVMAYLGDGASSWTSDEMQDALTAETAAQLARCRVPATYPADLCQALLRRVARNLAMRSLPLAMAQGDADVSLTFLPSNDPEVRRLEAPWRRLVVG